MRFLRSLVPSLLLLAAGAAQAASSWGFDEGSLTVRGKKADQATKIKFSDKSLPEKPVTLASADTLKIVLTAQENSKAKRPHQAFLVLREVDTDLEAPFPLTVKDTGKGVVEIKHHDIPIQLLRSSKPLSASLVLASFGSSEGYNKELFKVQIRLDPAIAQPVYEKPLRYGKLEEIHHIFRGDPKSPPKIISIVFVLAVVATVPLLFVSWLVLGANAAHLPKAFAAAPVSHGIFFGSIIAMELVFYLYYTTWNLFQVLPVIGVVGTATFLSGTRALGEVQSRRLAGER